jgi:hypothetical protein
VDPLLQNSLAYEDKLLLKLRIERLKSPLAYSQRRRRSSAGSNAAGAPAVAAADIWVI